MAAKVFPRTAVQPKLPVDNERRVTASARRANVIATVTREFDLENPLSSACRFAEILRSPRPRFMIISGDIDGIVSAAMLARVAPDWRGVAIIVKSGRVLVHPDFADGLNVKDFFGVDVFSTYLDNVSNHVSLWGSKRPAARADAFAIAAAYDSEVQRRSQGKLLATPSLWAGVEGFRRLAAGRKPLGTVTP